MSFFTSHIYASMVDKVFNRVPSDPLVFNYIKSILTDKYAVYSMPNNCFIIYVIDYENDSRALVIDSTDIERPDFESWLKSQLI